MRIPYRLWWSRRSTESWAMPYSPMKNNWKFSWKQYRLSLTLQRSSRYIKTERMPVHRTDISGKSLFCREVPGARCQGRYCNGSCWLQGPWTAFGIHGPGQFDIWKTHLRPTEPVFIEFIQCCLILCPSYAPSWPLNWLTGSFDTSIMPHKCCKLLVCIIIIINKMQVWFSSWKSMKNICAVDLWA